MRIIMIGTGIAGYAAGKAKARGAVVAAALASCAKGRVLFAASTFGAERVCNV